MGEAIALAYICLFAAEHSDEWGRLLLRDGFEEGDKRLIILSVGYFHNVCLGEGSAGVDGDRAKMGVEGVWIVFEWLNFGGKQWTHLNLLWFIDILQKCELILKIDKLIIHKEVIGLWQYWKGYKEFKDL